MDQEDNRYETESQAEDNSQEEQQQREVRQVLNRLRDLARRQEDLNKELAQLQSALEKAETEEEKEEIERQLKRLREQQQDLLRETDELNERMQPPENQQQMAEASQQLEETRENVRKAGEALERNDAAEALTAGRRAEREFEEMRDEFRQQAAGEFNEMMREKCAPTRRNSIENKKSCPKNCKSLASREQNTRAYAVRTIVNRFARTSKNRARSSVSCSSECEPPWKNRRSAEPLLAQKLYDSYRQTQQRQVERQLDETSELLRRGFEPQAREMEAGASRGIDQLREDLEEAAATVLGDETKASATRTR